MFLIMMQAHLLHCVTYIKGPNVVRLVPLTDTTCLELRSNYNSQQLKVLIALGYDGLKDCID